MAKARITSNNGEGLYGIELEFDSSTLDNQIAALAQQLIDIEQIVLDARVAVIEAEDVRDSLANDLDLAIDAYAAGGESEPVIAATKALAEAVSALNVARFKVQRISGQKLSLAARKTQLENTIIGNQASAGDLVWCADYTDDIANGTIVPVAVPPGEFSAAPWVILPRQHPAGYGGTYDRGLHGQMVPRLSMSPAATFYNWALLPGWQRWMPTHRIGTLTFVDQDTDTCNVTLDTARSSANPWPYTAGLNVNLAESTATVLTGVPIRYMTCNAAVFEAGDRVLVRFAQPSKATAGPGAWDGAEVIGFVSNPRSCGVFPLFMMRRPDLLIDQDEILLWDHFAPPDTVKPVTWRSRMARPETYITDDDGNVTGTLSPTVAREKCGDVDWTGWDGLSLSWDGHKEPPTDEDLPYGGVNNRYFHNYALDSVVTRFASRLYFNGIGFSTISDFLGGAISTITVGGEQGTYVHYLTYFPGTSSTRAIRIFRRPFDIATGLFTSFPQLRNSFLIGNSGRYAGPFHFNASGLVAKGIATKKREDSDNADDLHIVTFTIDPANGNVTVEDESVVAEASGSSSNQLNITLGETYYPAPPIKEFLLSSCGPDGFTQNGYRHRFKLAWDRNGGFQDRREAIVAVDFVGDEPVYLRSREERVFSRTRQGLEPAAQTTWYRLPNAGLAPEPNPGSQCLFGPAEVIVLNEIYSLNGTGEQEIVGGDDTYNGTGTQTLTITNRITIEGAYEHTVLENVFTESAQMSGSGGGGGATWTTTYSRTKELLRGSSAPLSSTPACGFIGLDLRTNAYILELNYRDGFTNTYNGSSGDDVRETFVVKTDIIYRFSEDDQGIHEGKNAHELSNVQIPAFWGTGISQEIGGFNAGDGSYDGNTGNGAYANTGSDELVVSVGWYVWLFGRPLYEPAALASMNFKPGIGNSPVAILYSYTIDQSDADSPAPNEVYAGTVSNAAGMNRTQEQLRELFGDGELPYAEQDLEQDFRPVRFGGFGGAIKPDSE